MKDLLAADLKKEYTYFYSVTEYAVGFVHTGVFTVENPITSEAEYKTFLKYLYSYLGLPSIGTGVNTISLVGVTE